MSSELLAVRVTVTRALALADLATGGVMTFLACSRLGLQMRALDNSRDHHPDDGGREFKS